MLYLAPADQSTNYILRVVTGDVVKAETLGVDETNPYVRHLNMVIDPITFFADYPVISATANEMGHTANTFCTLCVI